VTTEYKIEEQIHSKTVTVKIPVKRNCDMCGVALSLYRNNYYSRYLEDEATGDAMITLVTEYSDWERDGSRASGFKVDDLCPTCMLKVKDLLESAGVNVTKFKYTRD